MKQLSTEEKAKAYDEANKWMESVYPSLTHEQQMEAEAFFPELAIAQDEKIRKEIVSFLNGTRFTEPSTEERVKWIVWIEKQGEQKQVEVRPFNKVFSQEQIDEIDKRIEKEIKLYNAKLMEAQMRAKDFPMTD